MYRVQADSARQRVAVTFNGGYTDDEMADFEDALKAAVLAVRKVAPQFDLLVDFRDASVMPQAVADDGARRIGWCLEQGLRRSANITTSTLVKLQIRRVAADPRFGYFTNMADAIAWLES